MDYKNIQLWYAYNSNNEIVEINKINESNKNEEYTCPLCGSLVIPKAIKEESKVSPHFAHIDKSKCKSEHMIHWWVKNKLIEKGDKFKIKTNEEIEYVCKGIMIENHIKLKNGGIYNPDLTIITEGDKEIYFEINYKNKKKVEDYIDIWIELGNTVVEVDTKDILNGDKKFKVLYYNGKIFNQKKKSKILKYKEKIIDESENKEEMIKKLEKLKWLLDDIRRYKKGEIKEDVILERVDYCDEESDFIMLNILDKSCVDLKNKYEEYRNKCIKILLKNEIDKLNSYIKKRYKLINYIITYSIDSNNELRLHVYVEEKNDKITTVFKTWRSIFKNKKQLVCFIKDVNSRILYSYKRRLEAIKTNRILNSNNFKKALEDVKNINNYKYNIEMEYEDNYIIMILDYGRYSTFSGFNSRSRSRIDTKKHKIYDIMEYQYIYNLLLDMYNSMVERCYISSKHFFSNIPDINNANDIKEEDINCVYELIDNIKNRYDKVEGVKKDGYKMSYRSCKLNVLQEFPNLIRFTINDTGIYTILTGNYIYINKNNKNKILLLKNVDYKNIEYLTGVIINIYSKEIRRIKYKN